MSRLYTFTLLGVTVKIPFNLELGHYDLLFSDNMIRSASRR
jgi:hypothetical protein